LTSTTTALRRHNTVGRTVYAAAGSWGELLFFVVLGLLLFVASRWIALDGDVQTGYVLAILYTMAPLQTIMMWAPHLAQARVALQRVDRLIGTLPSCEPNSADEERGWPAARQIELRSVVHHYPVQGSEEGFRLGPIDLTIRRGEILFLVGGNGSGKTTLGKLIAGLYAPEAGYVTVDGRAIGEDSREALRQQFSAVFADPYLLERLFGLDGSSDAEANHWLRTLELDQVVRIVEGKFSTTDLSRGQRKRLALTTALLEDRPFFLFDEWAADQDPRFKHIFYTQLLPALRAEGKGVVAIMHDDRYLHVADRVIELEYGAIRRETARSPAERAAMLTAR
jgi:putative ATP-binding cassette transporter